LLDRQIGRLLAFQNPPNVNAGPAIDRLGVNCIADQAFRQARMREECGPITDPQLHQQCLDSFARY
jgi:hypothetical protein